MTVELQNVVGIVFLVIFVLSAMIALADAIGWATIRSGWQRKALFGSTIASPIAAIALLGETLFTPSGDKPQLPAPTPVASVTATSPTGPPTKLPTGEVPTATDTDSVTETDLASQPPTAEIANWAHDNLPARPKILNAQNAPYPPCVKQARDKDIADVTRQEADDCYENLEIFNRDVLLKYQQSRTEYISAVKNASRSQSSLEILAFLRTELRSFTYPEGVDYQAFNRLGNQFLADQKWIGRLLP